MNHLYFCFAHPATRRLSVISLSAGLLTLLLWAGFTSHGLIYAVERAAAVLIISFPPALGLAVPLVAAAAATIAAHSGLIIGNRDTFEKAHKTQAIIFNKTGTLTNGLFTITDILLFDKNMSEDALTGYAAAVEQYSEHPVAQGLVRGIKEIWAVEDCKALTGNGAEGNIKGAEGTVNGKNVKAVSAGYLRDKNMNINDKRLLEWGQQGKTAIFILIDGQFKGAIALADSIRPDSRDAIAKLKAMGIRCILMTGGQEETAGWLAHEIGLDEIIATTGDGEQNDASALTQADIAFANRTPSDIADLFELSKATHAKTVQNLIWVTGYSALAIPAAAGIFAPLGIVISPALGAVLVSLSTVICAVNAKRLKLGLQDYASIKGTVMPVCLS
jgi:Cu2+-exporting ATPase